MNKTIFLDIDGVLVRHHGSMSNQARFFTDILPGTLEKLDEWDRAGHKIILTTGRRESLRTRTEELLRKLGIYYDLLIMGLPRGARVVINDLKPDSDTPTAIGINLLRNEGIREVQL